MPRIFWAVSRAAAAPLTTFTPPPLPRPPAWICALTTTNSLSVSAISAFAAASASSMLNAGRPLGTGTPSFLRISFAWYSWIFTAPYSFLPASMTSPTAAARARDDRRQLVRGDELLDGDAVDGAVADHRHHRVAVSAQHHRAHVLHRHARGLREEQLEARRVEDAGHADD